ncbi:hypothetical protein M0804_002120 [Polistes exclamans]|nr:hypothetical protein M0804_002120 [Polistes exclamans]
MVCLSVTITVGAAAKFGWDAVNLQPRHFTYTRIHSRIGKHMPTKEYDYPDTVFLLFKYVIDWYEYVSRKCNRFLPLERIAL